MNSTRFNKEDLREAYHDAYIKQTVRAVLAKMSEESEKLSRLGKSDEEIYTHCARLMSSYSETISLYEQFRREIVSPEVVEIIDGIITVLVSRLREFEDISESGSDNPITEEKQAIISRALVRMEDSITGALPTSESLYESYISHLNECRSQLNDLNNRGKLQLYLALMEDEWEILSTIIKIQVGVLEMAVSHAIDGALEKIAVHKILSILREAYQHFGRACTEVSAVFHHLDVAADEWKPEPYEKFEAFVSEQSERAGAHDPRLATLKAELDQEVDAIFGRLKLDFFKLIYRFRRMVNDDLMLAAEMTDIFIKLSEFWPESDTEGEGADILRGIAETVEIKIEGLRESSGQIKTDAFGLIQEFSDTHDIAPTDDEKSEAKAFAWREWDQEPDSLPIFTERSQNLAKESARFQEILEKRLAKFKREILLYEVSTYEEIIFYSVSRLRESGGFDEAVNLAADTMQNLEILLKKNNIEVIRPAPHEPFNPKEHEVLMAEPSPDFNKGEIVKLMNSGYRQHNTILLRANVIAAR